MAYIHAQSVDKGISSQLAKLHYPSLQLTRHLQQNWSASFKLQHKQLCWMLGSSPCSDG